MKKFKEILLEEVSNYLNYNLIEVEKEEGKKFIFTYENIVLKEYVINFNVEILEDEKIEINDNGEILRLIIREGGFYEDVKKMFNFNEKDGVYYVELHQSDFFQTIEEINLKVFTLLMDIEYQF